MNIVEALNVALPELPVQAIKATRLPRMNPGVIAREQVQDGQRKVLALVPELHRFYTLDELQWKLLQLFDGKRTYQEIADLYATQTGVVMSEQAVREFAEDSQASQGSHLWYRTPQEKNASLFERLRDERLGRVKKKSKWGDLSQITFSAWDPDIFLTKLHNKIKFVFSRWFVLLNLAMFTLTALIFISHWGEIGRDNLELYNFSNKTFWEIVEFWVLVLIISFIHEVAHGLGCKHSGGESHHIGFLLIYLSPAFFCDITETWVYGGKWPRIVTVVAGIWSTLIICSVATFVWWASPVGGPVHNFAYMVMLVAGVLPVVINLNPLIKLDGYFLFTELLEMSELQENSTAYVSGWVKKNIFRLPVEVPPVSKRQRWLYLPYVLLSGAYAYTLLYFVVHLVYNIARHYSPEWAFIPAALIAWLIFKGRILSLARFMKILYLDKRERLHAWFAMPKKLAFAAGAMLLLFAPVWRETVQGRFVLQPVRRALIRNEVPGVVFATSAEEGKYVSAGSPLFRLRNLALQSQAAQLESEWRIASARATQAQLHYADFSATEQERQNLAQRHRLVQEQLARLTIASPISGIVVTPHVRDVLGSYLAPGTMIAEVADFSTMQARLYVPALDVRKVRTGAPAALHLDGVGAGVNASVGFIAPASSDIEEGLIERSSYSGMHAPQYYAVTLLVPNPLRSLSDGMSGTAKVLVQRRSLAGFSGEVVYEFLRRKLW